MFEPRVVAALDFGTHGTGFAWAVVEPGNADPHSRRIHFCNRWEAQPVACAKNLSALLLSPEGDVLAWGFDARRRFLTQGRKSTPGALSYHAGFKMALLTKPVDAEDTEEAEGEDEQTGDRRRTDSTDEVADADDDSDIEEDEEDSLPGDSATPALITAYLRKVYARALEQITASGYSEDEIRWCLTIPAIWSDYQKQVMRDVAKNAGFPTEDGRLILALEPEAAAHYARVCGVSIASGDGSPADLMTAGARFMVADCGGGTVDITAYENDSAGRMVEIGRVNGGRLGSDYLNRAFEDQFLVSRFGGAAVLQELREEYPEALLDLTDAWERAKLHIGVDQQEPIYLNIPSAIDRHLGAAGRRRLRRLQDNVCDAIVITAAEVRSLFDNVVPDILELIDDQLDEMRQSRTETSQSDVVLLVGGFSTSPYLQQSVKDHLGDRAAVLIPPDPNVAVLFGAVHFCYEPHTRARRSRFTYGVASNMEFEEGIDPEELRRVSKSTGNILCRERFSMFVSAGQTVDVDQEVIHVYTPVEATQTKVQFDLHATVNSDPRYVTEPGCDKIGTIVADVQSVMRFALEDRAVRIHMRFGETEFKVRAVVVQTDEEVQVTARFHSNY